MARRRSSDPSSPDYECPAYVEQARRWKIVSDVRESTEALRDNAAYYLPRFESEDRKDWLARVRMTFANDYYEQTLADHVGLVFAEEPTLEKDVPSRIATLLENADGEGTHWQVLAARGFEKGLDYGHAAIWTDFPDVDASQRVTDKAREAAQQRPYWNILGADEIVSWIPVRIGGVEMIAQFVRKEETTVSDGTYGTKTACQYRVITQAVTRDANNMPTGLGAITWTLWTEATDGTASVQIGTGVIVGPKTIPLRPFYCGEKLGLLHSKPFLYNLAWTSIEETQVGSDYAAVMHRCNVPVPVFSGLAAGEQINMSQGINLPTGGTAEYLEPAGSAIDATRQRIEDIRAQMRRQGAAMPASDTAKAMTATEAAQVARQRNARLAKAARSLQDALEGALSDMAAYLGLPDGGSVHINQDFAGTAVDPIWLDQVGKAYDRGVITRDEYRYAVRNGALPDDVDEVAVQEILDATEAEKVKAEADAAAKTRAALAGGAPASGDPVPADKAA